MYICGVGKGPPVVSVVNNAQCGLQSKEHDLSVYFNMDWTCFFEDMCAQSPRNYPQRRVQLDKIISVQVVNMYCMQVLNINCKALLIKI